MNKNRIKGFDGLRGIAILGIAFLYHYKVVYGIEWENKIFDTACAYAFLGVEIFFGISGFIISYNYSGKVSECTLKVFLQKRLKRLMPLAIISTVIVGIEHIVVVTNDLPIFTHVIGINTLLNFAYNLLGIQTSIFPPLETSGQSFNLPLWFISVLIVCYIWFWIYEHVKEEYKFLIFGVVVSLFMWVLINNPGVSILPLFNIPTARGMVAFSIGTSLGNLKEGFARKNKFIFLSLVSIFLWVMIAAYNVNFLGNFNVSFDLFIVLPVIYLCGYCKIIQRVLDIALLRYLGKISYSVFIWNFPIQMFFLIINFKYVNIDFKDFRIYVINIVITLFVAIISYFLFENKNRIKQ